MAKMYIKKDDKVVVISGKDKGKKGKVLVAEPKDGRICCREGQYDDKTRETQRSGKAGRYRAQEAPMYASKVMLVCGKCGKPTRIAFKLLENKSKVRVCKKCGETFDK